MGLQNKESETELANAVDVTYLVDPGTYINLEFVAFQYVLVQDLYSAESGVISEEDEKHPERCQGDKIFGALEMSSRDSEINQKTSFASISGIVGHDSNASYKQTVVVNSHEPHHLPTSLLLTLGKMRGLRSITAQVSLLFVYEISVTVLPRDMWMCRRVTTISLEYLPKSIAPRMVTTEARRCYKSEQDSFGTYTERNNSNDFDSCDVELERGDDNGGARNFRSAPSRTVVQVIVIVVERC